MKEEKPKSDKVDDLQRRTEESLRKKKTKKTQDMTGMETPALVHELQVHQTELEMQNEELKHARAEAEDALNKYAELYDFAPVGYFTLDKHGILLDANLAGAMLLGVERSSLINRYFHLFIRPEYLPNFNTFCNKMVETDTKQTCEIELVKADASTVCVRLEGILTAGGKGKQFQVVAIDITAQKHASEEIYLLQTITFALSVSENLHDALVIALHKICNFTGWIYGEAWRPGSDGVFLVRDRAYYSAIEDLKKFSAYTEGLAFTKGSGLPGCAWAEKQSIWVQNVTLDPSYLCPSIVREAGLKTGIAFPVIADNEVIYVIVFYNTRATERDERLIKLILMVLSQIGLIFKRIQAEERLRESEEKLRTILDNTPAVVCIKDMHGKYTFINREFENLFRIKREETKGKTPYDYFPKEIAASHLENDQKVFEAKIPMQFDEVATHSNGQLHSYLSVKFPLFDPAGAVYAVCGISTDITERKRMKELVQKERDKVQKYLDIAPAIFLVLDAAGKTLLINKKGCKLLGCTDSEIVGKNWIDTWISPRVRDKIKAEFVKVIQGKIPPYEYYETPLATKDGHERIIAWYSSLLKDEKSTIVGTLSSGEDITERRRAEVEQEKLREQLYHSQNLASVGKLAGGIAHNFNNLLTVVMGYASLMLAATKEGGLLREYAEKILKSSRRATDLTKDLLAFSRKQPTCLKPINLNGIIRESESLLSKLLQADIKLKTILAKKDCVVEADTGQIEQVLMNLATNARDAMPSGGSLTISTDIVKIDDEFKKTHGYGKIGNYVRIAITDTGVGMDNYTKSRIFEPFFTTKDVGKGTGLGLSSVYGIVKQHSGYIDVDSAPGKGTAFIIYLPLIESEAERVKAEVPAALPKGIGSILLAEDESEVRGLMRMVFEGSGYKVIEAVDGEDALDKFTKDKDSINLLVFDLIMPKKGGKEAYDEIKKTRPDAKVLFITGYDEEVISRTDIHKEGLNYILKPVSPMELLKKVNEVLNKSQ